MEASPPDWGRPETRSVVTERVTRYRDQGASIIDAIDLESTGPTTDKRAATTADDVVSG